MARRKNTKRIDPRYFLHETVNRGETLEQWCAGKTKNQAEFQDCVNNPAPYRMQETANRHDDGSALEEASYMPGYDLHKAPGPGIGVRDPSTGGDIPWDKVPCDKRGKKRPDWIARKNYNYADIQGKCGEELDEGVGDDIAAVIEYAVQKGLKDGMRPEDAAQIFAEIAGENTYAEEDVEAAYENWERYDLGGVDPDAMEL
jgi:hypothetical protein